MIRYIFVGWGRKLPGLVLLNIDRQLEDAKNPLQEINTLIDEIFEFLRKFPPETPSVRLVPLKMKLRQLLDVVSQFGADGSMNVNEKQSTIMQLHNQFQMLTNNLLQYQGNFSDFSDICSSYLLNHLCSTAAVDPRATVIGVSNVMAQVLSQGIQIIEDPDLEVVSVDARYFENFALRFNQMLTIAGLFSAPVLGLPDIPISQLGSWSDQALSQFASIFRFIDKFYRPLTFYKIEKEMKAHPFDTTSDILSFYIYLNEFFAALIARADLLSGIEFPAEFTHDNQSVILQSTNQINEILATSIEINCKKIEDHLASIQELYDNGVIDRNEKPNENENLVDYYPEINLWRIIAKFAKMMQVLFDSQQLEYKIDDHRREAIQRLSIYNEELPSVQSSPLDIEYEMVGMINDFIFEIQRLFPQCTMVDVTDFIKSSDFTKFRQFLQYLIHIVAAHDIFLRIEILWTPWLISKYGKFFMESTTAYNPLSALEAGILTIFLGIRDNSSFLVQDGLSIINNSKKYLEFQLHHFLTIEIISKLITIGIHNLKDRIGEVITIIESFLEEFQLSQNSLLHQRASLYKGILQIYQAPSNDPEQDPFSMMNARFVTFDPFSWIQLPNDFKPVFPYISLNTSLANLYAG